MILTEEIREGEENFFLRYNLQRTLRAFKVDAKCEAVSELRNMVLYDLRLAPGTRIRELENFSDEIALALRSKSKPFFRPITEKGIVRMELINQNTSKLNFFDEFLKLKLGEGVLPFYLGNSSDGQDVWVDMVKNPHLLVAGSTGSGKSTLLHSIIANAVFSDNVNIYVIDTKGVEFQEYADKLSNVKLANSYKQGYELLKSLHEEMKIRYSFLKKTATGSVIPWYPHIMLIIDEFADLIVQDDNKKFATLFNTLTQKCRAAGIHCVLATQRPSVDIISGTIKANFPARIACQVASSTDARVVMDTNGAELLAGNGDAIIKNYNHNFQRFQSAYTTPQEVIAYAQYK